MALRVKKVEGDNGQGASFYEPRHILVDCFSSIPFKKSIFAAMK